MANINKIRISGTSYDIQDSNATKVVDITQAAYDALPSSAKTANILYNITDAEAIDFSEYWTSAETQSAITEATSGKVSTSDFNAYSGSVNTALNSKASQTDLNTLSGTVTSHTSNTTIHVSTEQIAAWNAKSDFSGSYNDLADKPTIPTVPTSNTAFTNDAGYITANDVTGKTDVTAFTAHTGDMTIHVTSSEKATWNNKSDFSGNYNDLSNKPTIPTSASQLTNDTGYITSSALNGYATTGDVQTATNDMATQTWVNNQGFLTQHQDISGKQDVSGMTAYTETTAFTAHTASTVHMTTTEKTNLDSLATNIAAISGITSTKVGNWDTASTNSHTHSNKTVLDGINSTKVSNWDGAATNASNAITALGGLKLVKLTQQQYDSLSTKDNSTLYVIVN